MPSFQPQKLNSALTCTAYCRKWRVTHVKALGHHAGPKYIDFGHFLPSPSSDTWVFIECFLVLTYVCA